MHLLRIFIIDRSASRVYDTYAIREKKNMYRRKYNRTELWVLSECDYKNVWGK